MGTPEIHREDTKIPEPKPSAKHTKGGEEHTEEQDNYLTEKQMNSSIKKTSDPIDPEINT